ncbi:MAG: MerR family transcriptional regulator, partial [Bacilli bacterium]
MNTKEPQYFLIGAVSKSTNVSVQTLRFYEQKGILQPSKVDEDSGYRYYTEDDLVRIRMIRDLRSLNCTLEEISQLVNSSSATQLLELYQKKFTELEEKRREIDDLQKQIASKKARLMHLIEDEIELNVEEVMVTFSEGHWVLSIRSETELTKESATHHFVALYQKCAALQLKAEGSMYAIFYHKNPISNNGIKYDIEYCLPVTYSSQNASNLRYIEPTMLAILNSIGPREQTDYFQKIYDWIDKNNYE